MSVANRFRPSRRLLFTLSLVASTPLVAAESELSGRVVDRSRDPVAAARVTLTCGEVAAPIELVADELGRFRVALPAGCEPRLAAALPDGSAATGAIAAAAGEVELALDVDLFREHIEVQAAPARDSVGSREVRESFARDAGEAAARVAGVEALRKGGIATDLVIRGLKGSDVEVRVDGHRLFGACPNRMDPPAFHVDFAEIERIDVVKGASDSLLGAGLASTVDIVTRQPAPGLHFEAQTTAGSFGYLAPSASLAWGGSRWSAKAGWASRQGDPFEDGDGVAFTDAIPAGQPAAYREGAGNERAFDVNTGWAGVSFSPAPGQRLELDLARQRSDLQLYPYLQMDAVRDDADRARAAWSLERGGGALRRLEVAAARTAVEHDMDNRLRASAGMSPTGWSMRSLAESEVVDGRVVADLAGGWSVGLDGWRRDWSATNTMAMMGNLVEQRSLPDTRAESIALHAQTRRTLAEGLALRVSARVEQVETSARPAESQVALWRSYHGASASSASDTLAGGRVELAWEPARGWELAAGLARGSRAPDGQERYAALVRSGSDWVGNPGLDPAVNDQLDLGARFTGERFSADVDAWYSRVGDAITLVEVDRPMAMPGSMNTRARSWVNHDTELWGAEATARWVLGRSLLLSASAAWTAGRRDLAPGRGIVDRDPAEVPPLTARLALRWEPGAWFVEVEPSAAARQDEVDSGLQEAPTPGWFVVDLRGGWQGRRLGVVAGVANLLDRDYHEHLSYQRDPFRAGFPVDEPGRAATLALRWRG